MALKYDSDKLKMGFVLGGFSHAITKILANCSFNPMYDIDEQIKEALKHILVAYNFKKQSDIKEAEKCFQRAVIVLIKKQVGLNHTLIDVCKIGNFGAEKYGVDQWRDLENAYERYLDAALRHLFNYTLGEEMDKEMDLPHLAAATWNLLAVLEVIYD